jgi:hypothetical protein
MERNPALRGPSIEQRSRTAGFRLVGSRPPLLETQIDSNSHSGPRPPSLNTFLCSTTLDRLLRSPGAEGWFRPIVVAAGTAPWDRAVARSGVRGELNGAEDPDAAFEGDSGVREVPGDLAEPEFAVQTQRRFIAGIGEIPRPAGAPRDPGQPSSGDRSSDPMASVLQRHPTPDQVVAVGSNARRRVSRGSETVNTSVADDLPQLGHPQSALGICQVLVKAQ